MLSVSTLAEPAMARSDDLALCQQAFNPRINQPLTELVEVENTGKQHDQRCKIEIQDAAGQAGKYAAAQRSPDYQERIGPGSRINGLLRRTGFFAYLLFLGLSIMDTRRHLSDQTGFNLRGTGNRPRKAFRSYRIRHQPS